MRRAGGGEESKRKLGYGGRKENLFGTKGTPTSDTPGFHVGRGSESGRERLDLVKRERRVLLLTKGNFSDQKN